MVIGLVRSRDDLPGADLQLIFVDLARPVAGFTGSEPGFGYTIGVSVMLPHSRGTVRLADATPGSAPLIDPNYFGDSRDLDAVIAGLRLARRMAYGSELLQSLRHLGRPAPRFWRRGAGLTAFDQWRDAEIAPGPATDDEAELRDYARATVASYCHPVGTLAMGDSPDAVVDPDLKLRGIDGVRIADASVMPAIPAGNTNATVYAIAERATELILED